MRQKFDEKVLTKIIDSKYPTEAKVLQIMSLYSTDRVELLNRVSNRIGEVIDEARNE